MKQKIKSSEPYREFNGDKWKWWIKVYYNKNLNYYFGNTKSEVVAKFAEGIRAYYKGLEEENV